MSVILKTKFSILQFQKKNSTISRIKLKLVTIPLTYLASLSLVPPNDPWTPIPHPPHTSHFIGMRSERGGGVSIYHPLPWSLRYKVLFPVNKDESSYCGHDFGRRKDETTLSFDASSSHRQIFPKTSTLTSHVVALQVAALTLSLFLPQPFLLAGKPTLILLSGDSPPIPPPWVPASSSTYTLRSCSFPVSLSNSPKPKSLLLDAKFGFLAFFVRFLLLGLVLISSSFPPLVLGLWNSWIEEADLMLFAVV